MQSGNFIPKVRKTFHLVWFACRPKSTEEWVLVNKAYCCNLVMKQNEFNEEITFEQNSLHVNEVWLFIVTNTNNPNKKKTLTR